MSDKLIHVTVDTATQEELSNIRDLMEGVLEDSDMSGKLVVSDGRMELHEVPALDAYTDELADKVAERINEGDG